MKTDEISEELRARLEERAQVEERVMSDVADTAIDEYLARRMPPERFYGTRALDEWQARLKAGNRKAMDDLSDAAHPRVPFPSEPMKVSTYQELASVIAFLAVMNKTLVLLFRGQTSSWALAPTLTGRRGTSPSATERCPPTTTGPTTSGSWRPSVPSSGRSCAVEDSRGGATWSTSHPPPGPWCSTTSCGPPRSSTSARRCGWPPLSRSQANPQHPSGVLDVVGVGAVSSDLMTFQGPELAVRLNSVCPPGAVRPHVQEGVLIGWHRERSSHSAEPPPALPSEAKPYLPIARIQLANEAGAFWDDDDYPIARHEFLLPPKEQDLLLQEFEERLRYDRDDHGRAVARAARGRAPRAIAGDRRPD